MAEWNDGEAVPVREEVADGGFEELVHLGEDRVWGVEVETAEGDGFAEDASPEEGDGFVCLARKRGGGFWGRIGGVHSAGHFSEEGECYFDFWAD